MSFSIPELRFIPRGLRRIQKCRLVGHGLARSVQSRVSIFVFQTVQPFHLISLEAHLASFISAIYFFRTLFLSRSSATLSYQSLPGLNSFKGLLLVRSLSILTSRHHRSVVHSVQSPGVPNSIPLLVQPFACYSSHL